MKEDHCVVTRLLGHQRQHFFFFCAAMLAAAPVQSYRGGRTNSCLKINSEAPPMWQSMQLAIIMALFCGGGGDPCISIWHHAETASRHEQEHPTVLCTGSSFLLSFLSFLVSICSRTTSVTYDGDQKNLSTYVRYNNVRTYCEYMQ